MLEGVRGLHKRGLELLWLHPKSKRPIDLNWTKQPKKNFKELERQYQNGMNIGVRLGSWSKSGDHYLGVIDCDVKSNETRHKEEMRKKLKELFPDIMDQAPFVASGRGNGSGHLYIKTREVVKGFRLAQSSEKVRVKMPSSIKPTRADEAEFSAAELKEGWRLRAAWEISFMGEGQQVVLPPSVHPDTGKQYKWVKPLGMVPEVVLPTTSSNIKEKTTTGSEVFVPEMVDLIALDLSERSYGLITKGENCEDRSASLMSACISLLKVGLTDNQILSVLTDRENFLGEVAYDHRKTSDRSNAAAWVRDHTLAKAKAQTEAASVFDEVVEITNVETEKSWTDGLDKTQQGAIKTTLKNCVMILQNEVSPKLFVRNDFAHRDSYGSASPWGGKKDLMITDDDIVQMKYWFATQYKLEPNVNILHEAVACIAKQNNYHPVKDLIESVEWDGKPRVDNWLKKYLGAEAPKEYLKAISRKTLCAMIARIYQPGIKFDHVLVLEGMQGIGKSSASAILAGDQWFLDSLPNIRDKDAQLALQGNWIVEIAELAVLNRSDSESYKMFLSARVDKVRAPYGKRWEDYPRQCIFIGTTNADEYLKDKSGNRRFWPVRVKQCLFTELARDRQQLLAEAKVIWEDLHEPLYLEDVAKVQAEAIQADRVVEDNGAIMEDMFIEFLERDKKKPLEEQVVSNPDKSFKLNALFIDGPGGGIDHAFGDFKGINPYNNFAGQVLRKHGFERCRIGNGKGWRKISTYPHKNTYPGKVENAENDNF